MFPLVLVMHIHITLYCAHKSSDRQIDCNVHRLANWELSHYRVFSVQVSQYPNSIFLIQ